MKLPRVTEWTIAGDSETGHASIERRSISAHWWLLDRWLDFAHCSIVEPLEKVLTNDQMSPLCEGYFTWANRLYFPRWRRDFYVDVPFAALPTEERMRIERQLMSEAP